MKTLILLLLILFISTVIFAQTVTDTREYGSWVFGISKGKGNDDHFKPVNKFPPATITGPVKIGYGAEKTVKLPPAVQNKMQAILQLFKDAYPKPYKESVCYGVNYTPVNDGDKPFGYGIHIGDYGFQYNNLGKILPIVPGRQFGNMYEGYATIYVNSFPGSRYTLDGAFEVVKELSYYYSKSDDRKPKPLGEIYLVAPKDNFDKEIKAEKLTNAPPLSFGNEADNYFTIRHLTGYPKERENIVNYKIRNLVMLSADNQLPFKPLTRKQFIDLLEENINEKNLNRTAPIVGQIKKEFERNKEVLLLMRKAFANELNQPAIINEKYKSVINGGYFPDELNAKTIVNVFVTDRSKGWALYRYDSNFYGSMNEADVKTISVEWVDEINVPLNEKFPDANAKDKSGKLLTDVKFHRAMQYKFDWGKLASLLTK